MYSVQSAPATFQSAIKKKHVCNICDRSFTTTGHLARHLRVHTGERNHKCPFPGCEARFSRQDNLRQHYRIHLAPGSRRNSSSATWATGSATKTIRSATLSERSTNEPPTALEHAIPLLPHSLPPLISDEKSPAELCPHNAALDTHTEQWRSQIPNLTGSIIRA
ncbi:hypothetical protein OG21DRAFT_614942 [Imleria badia]|nr:hypothetical protein OG21DRAFT_614942 [Imleria badia]